MIAELTATYIIMFLGCGSAFIDKRINITHVGVAFTWAAVIVAMGYTFGHVSGCHMNPAVTIGFAAARKFPWKEVPFYVLAQTTGSTLACLMLLWLFSGEPTYVMLALPGGPNPFKKLGGIAVEELSSALSSLQGNKLDGAS
ncbi:hypothetical protein HPP92_024091 [Vanilla planifolia]|uniref:Aquaporin n=1 Tax=Vanilla planifolia TaxID=51239 RepID=A0A835PS45_VANPL|nr:hypothetical protein HPP92_024091 [Vanilla planifolia]